MDTLNQIFKETEILHNNQSAQKLTREMNKLCSWYCLKKIKFNNLQQCYPIYSFEHDNDIFKRGVRDLLTLYHINKIGGDIFPRCISQSNLAFLNCTASYGIKCVREHL